MRKLQLKRFDKIFTTREIALANLQKYENDYADGEIMAAAYHSTTAKTDEDIMYIVGIFVNKDAVKHLFTIDVKALEDKITEITEYIEKNLDFVKKVEHSATTESQYTEQTADLYVAENNLSDKTSTFQLKYDALSPENLSVPVSIGDITTKMKCSDLKGKPISEILDMMIFKTIYPSVTREPSASLTVSPALITPDTEITLASGYTYGQAAVLFEDGTRNYTANTSTNPTSVSIKLGGTDITSLKQKPTTLGNNTYVLTVNYGAGEVLHDSKGNVAKTILNGTQSNPHAAGSVTASASVNVSLPVYYSVGTESDKALDLKNWGGATWLQIHIKDVTDSNKLTIKVPTGRTLTQVAVLNPNKPANAEGSYDTNITSKMKQTGTDNHYNHDYNIYKSDNVTEIGDFQYLIKIS